MKIIASGDKGFEKAIERLDARMGAGDTSVEKTVRLIIDNVRKKGDSALLAYTKKFDRTSMTAKTVKVSDAEFAKAEKSADPEVANAMKKAIKRIRFFHKHQVEKSWRIEEPGATLGQIINPIEAVGIYVPGGKASYPSSVLMSVIPAKIASVKRIVMTAPAPDGVINPHVLLAAKLAGADEVYKIGGAQAIAALAFGTKTIAPVDKIVGPGNVYVAEAKRQVYGKVDIDMIAGPSEILIIADKHANSSHIAADLLSQAEHDENAWPILVTPSRKIADATKKELDTQSRLLSRHKIARSSLKKNCLMFVVKSLPEAFALSNRIAPEHLELLIKNADKHISKVKNAGALFVGPYTPEALGDYMAGPNHVLPTGGSARFFSPLGVYDFIKRTSLLHFSEKGFNALAKDVMTFAKEEKLTAHARAVEIRMKNQ